VKKDRRRYDDKPLQFISYNKVGYEIIFHKEKLMNFYHNDNRIYFFIFLPVNFDTSHLVSNTLEVEGYLNYEIDKKNLGDLFYALKSELKEEERFSSLIFNLKHFFTQNESMMNTFKIEFDNFKLIEPYRFELNIQPFDQKAFLTFQIENALKDPKLTFEIVDSDILIEELFELKNGIYIKADNKIVELIDYFIYNKNVF
jgi:hypothetical protein